MSDTLIGVLLGGLIAWVAPLMTLRYSERRWKFEAKLTHLKAERERFERLYESNLALFSDGLMKDSYSSNMIADLTILMPKEIGEAFLKFMEEEEKSELKGKHAYADLATAMKSDLARRDHEIRDLLG